MINKTITVDVDIDVWDALDEITEEEAIEFFDLRVLNRGEIAFDRQEVEHLLGMVEKSLTSIRENDIRYATRLLEDLKFDLEKI